MSVRGVVVHPTHKRGVDHRQAAFGHALDEVSVAEAQLPPHAQNDDIPIEAATFEQFNQTQKSRCLGRVRPCRSIIDTYVGNE